MDIIPNSVASRMEAVKPEQVAIPAAEGISSVLRIRGLRIAPPLFLAPMAGLTHSALRTAILSFGGIGLLSTEMLSATRLPAESAAISPYLIRTSSESPLSYQLLLSDVKRIPAVFAALDRLGADAVDLNLGCPAPCIRRSGGGSILMENHDLVRALVASARKQTALPLTAKIRLGERLDEARLRDFCRMLEGEGIDLLSVHARLRQESFMRRPKWDWIGRVKQWVGIPVIANGSIDSVAAARRCLAISGADGLMIGRAAARAPWIFAEIAREMYHVDVPAPGLSLPDLYREFIAALEERFQPERRLGRLKEFTHYFARNYPFGHHLASAIQSSGSMREAGQRAEAFFTVNTPGGKPAGKAEDGASRAHGRVEVPGSECGMTGFETFEPVSDAKGRN